MRRALGVPGGHFWPGLGEEVAAADWNLSLATHKVWAHTEGQRRQQTDWHHVVVWGKRAERVAERLRKGSLVYVSGRLWTRTWKDRDNRDRTSTEIQADQVVFLGTPAPRGWMGAANEPQPGEEFPHNPRPVAVGRYR